MVCENTVRRGLREGVDVGDLQVANQSEIHYLYELGDDERGFGELFFWDVAAVRQDAQGGDVELTAVLGECVEVLLDERVGKACPIFTNLLRSVVS